MTPEIDDETVEWATEALARERCMFNLDNQKSRVEWISSGYYSMDRRLARAALTAALACGWAKRDDVIEECAQVAEGDF